MNMERDLVEAYQDEITALQEEIQELKETYKENQKVLEYLSSVNINKALLSYHEKVVSQPGQIKDPVSVDLELDHCKKEIQFFNKISGIMFTKYFKKRVHKADNEDLYKHRLVGHCQSLTFQMEFESLDLTDKGGSCCDVTNLNIIMGSGEHSDLSNFVSRTEEKKNLLAFFRTLSNFADWSEYRRQTFVHFKFKSVTLSRPLRNQEASHKPPRSHCGDSEGEQDAGSIYSPSVARGYRSR
uniref:Uncharacterized protein n=1 Tax=Leptobrachium leishanense TaxID=445787 RepID=A0A8C5QY63_9ANUR